MTGAPDNKKIDTDALLARVDIVDVIDRYVPLKKSGAEYEACCPFHSEKSPSFKVSPTKQFYQCFGCGAHGDAIKFLREFRGVSFLDACAELGGESVAAGAGPVQREARKPARKRAEEEVVWSTLLPVPEDAPPAPKAHPFRGRPEVVYPYRDGQGRLLGYVYRLLTSDGGKETPQVTFCRSDKGVKEWRFRHFPEPRPLYGLDRLMAGAPGAQVLIVEGEKCVDAGALILPGLVVLSWPGGGKAVAKVDWSPLAGRKVVIWPDADAKTYKGKKFGDLEGTLMPAAEQPGIMTAEQIAQILLGIGCQVRLVNVPEPGVNPDGWDIADAVAEGWDRARLLEFIKTNLRDPSPRKPDDEPPPARPPCKKKSANPPPPPEQPSAEIGEPPPDDEWQRQLVRNEEGKILPELRNVRLTLTYHPAWRGVIFEDAFSHRLLKRKRPPFEGGEPGEWVDVDDTMTHDWLTANMRMMRLKTATVAQAVQAVAAMQAVNPVLDYLEALAWDGKPRLDSWLIEYMGAGEFFSERDGEREKKRKEDTNRYLMKAGPMWMLAAVARVFRPGCKFDNVLILEGQQGLGKSSALGILGGDWFMDTPFSLSDKDGMEALRGVWIVELPELDSFNKAESTTAKSFFSRGEDRFRLPYGKRSQKFKRNCVFAGTTNQDEYFRDMTGNRRYWPVYCRQFDRAALIRDRDQLWAEAVHRFKAGERYWPAKEDDALFSAEQSRREIMDPWYERIADWLDTLTQSAVTMGDILAECLKIDAARMDERSMATRVGRCMRKLGWVKKEDRAGKAGRFRYEKASDGDE